MYMYNIYTLSLADLRRRASLSDSFAALSPSGCREREFFIDNLLVQFHCIIVMIRWTGLAPWEFEFPFPGSLTSTFLVRGLVSQRLHPPRLGFGVQGLGFGVQGLGFSV